jgi:hypothetical protein
MCKIWMLMVAFACAAAATNATITITGDTHVVSHSTAAWHVLPLPLHSCCTVLNSSVAAYANCPGRYGARNDALTRRYESTKRPPPTLLPPPSTHPSALVRSVPASPTASVYMALGSA